MDGLKRRLRDSVRFRLSFWLSLSILAVAVIAGIFSFASAFEEAHELQDDVLRQVAALVDRQHLPLTHPAADTRLKDSDEESRVIVQYLGAASTKQGDVDAGSPLLLPTTLPDGMSTVRVNGESFRVLVKTTSVGERVAVAQETELRDVIARDSAMRTVAPFLILVPILLLVVASLVRNMFQPIYLLAEEIDLRKERELHPLSAEHIPSEIRPFVVAINRLLDRVAVSMETQRRFVADAAHELRSPLTALSLQAERLAEAAMSDTARERLVSLRQGIGRGRSLLDQLLTLAKTQVAPTPSSTSVSVMHVYRRVLEDLMPLAEAKQIDIGVEADVDAEVPVSEMDLATMVKNMVDNAIRYTPVGGRIDLSVTNGNQYATLQVKDSGPGIPPMEWERVFDPFYRVLGNTEVGSGLGLSIVKTVADRLGAKIELGYADQELYKGLCIRVIIPLTA